MKAFKALIFISIQFSEITGKYGPEITPYLETFHDVTNLLNCWINMTFNENIFVKQILFL